MLLILFTNCNAISYPLMGGSVRRVPTSMIGSDVKRWTHHGGSKATCIYTTKKATGKTTMQSEKNAGLSSRAANL